MTSKTNTQNIKMVRCCVTGCPNEAKIFMSNNLFDWPSESIPFCNDHYDLWAQHDEARTKIPKRQGLIVTINQLYNLIEELKDNFDDGTPNFSSNDDAKFQINIINKTSLSDTWEIEG